MSKGEKGLVQDVDDKVRCMIIMTRDGSEGGIRCLQGADSVKCS